MAERGDVIFVSAFTVPALEDRLKKEGIEFVHISEDAGTERDADKTARIASSQGADWIVVDGYQFGTEYQKRIKSSGTCLLFIDDYGHADHYCADIVLNQNIYADMSFYKKYEPYTRFLLGTKYALIRNEFQVWSGRHREIRVTARRILVTFGGSDPDNLTLKSVQAIRAVDTGDLETVIVIGGANCNFGVIEEMVRDNSRFRLIKNTENMPALMTWADIAISAGGSTCWELAFLGTPALVISIADNQIPVGQALGAQNAAIYLGEGKKIGCERISEKLKELLISPDLRSTLSRNSRQLVDGEGSSRVSMAITQSRVRLRKVKTSDCMTLWEWVNEPTTRESAFTSAHIPLEDHKEWFSRKIRDPDCFFFMGFDAYDNPVGQLRFDRKADTAIVDISIDSKWRGKGFGKHLLTQGIQEMLKTSIRTLTACIKKENTSSMRTFIACNFEFSANKIIKNNEALVLIRRLQ